MALFSRFPELEKLTEENLRKEIFSDLAKQKESQTTKDAVVTHVLNAFLAVVESRLLQDVGSPKFYELFAEFGDRSVSPADIGRSWEEAAKPLKTGTYSKIPPENARAFFEATHHLTGRWDPLRRIMRRFYLNKPSQKVFEVLWGGFFPSGLQASLAEWKGTTAPLYAEPLSFETSAETAAAATFGGGPSSMDSIVPKEWNEVAITRQLTQIRDQRPSLVPHFLHSITERFVLRQDDHTAQTRLLFLKTQIEQLKLAKDFQQAVIELEVLSLEKAKRLKTLELEGMELDQKKQILTEKQRLEVLREQKKIELEIAQLDHQITGIGAPAVQAPTADEKKKTALQSCEERIQDLKRMKQQAMRIPDEDERIQRGNAIDEAIHREYERWSKLL